MIPIFVTHSKKVQCLAKKYGWLPGARYTNLRDVRTFDQLGFLDIDWVNYNFVKHLEVAKRTRPLVTVARDVTRLSELPVILDQAYALAQFARTVVVVPKDPVMADRLESLIPSPFVLGYSVPSRYGQTPIALSAFTRPVHLLGGRPDVQRRLAGPLRVASLDCNRFTLDAAFGDYFDGARFRPHPRGGYDRCLKASIKNITSLWADYVPGP
jgi:hypothetical protein